ncbi:MAG: peptidyl-prolyl cis-trans isomerase, partial [Planctomycetes bacterium]|nr:peptidyl-prolyl cis-trans isomerase [Planctomycetota bacterium]
MSLRTAVVAPLMLAAVLTAQEKEKPQEPKALTPAQQAQKLEAEKARLKAEIEYARKRVENADSLLSSKLTRGKPQFKVIDAGKPKGMLPVQPKRVERKFARVGTPEEMRIGGGDAMVVVNRRGISQQQYDAVYEYLMSYNAQANPDLTAQRVLYDLIRIEGVAGSFVENPGRVKLGEALSKLQDGTMSFADAAKQYGTVAGAGEDGSVSITRNSVQGPFFEYMAFSTEQGKISRPFLTPRGYVVLKVENVQKGAQPALDKVDCKVVLFAFSENDKEMMDAQYLITSAQAEVLVRDESVLKQPPADGRAPAAASGRSRR